MRQYILQRLAMAIPVLLFVSLGAFILVRLAPGDVLLVKMGESGTLDPQRMEELRASLGFDKPLHEQYLVWLSNAVRGDFGESALSERPVLTEIFNRVPISLELGLLALIVSTLIAIPVGIISAVRQDTATDYVARMISLAGLSAPSFWIGTLVLVFPARWFGWTPPLGFVPFFDDPLRNLQQFMLPALVMGAAMSASVMRMTRSTLLEVLRQDYIRTAWAKGLRERAVITRHAMKNALIPVVTIIGLQFSHLLGGTVIMEQIFSLPGVGRLFLETLSNRDYPQLQGNVLFMAVVFVAGNLIVDITYGWLDPRIRFS